MYAFALILLLILVPAALFLWGRTSWRRVARLLFEQVRKNSKHAPSRIDLRETDNLPLPVRRYFRRVLRSDAPLIRFARFKQSGGFRVKLDAPGWSKMKAEQVFSTHPRAFAWNAEISIVPGFSIRVLDAYSHGVARMIGKLMGLFPLIDARSCEELNAGALQRYLAEAVWFPTALLPSQGVVWTATGEHKATASIVDQGVSASLEFEFNELGEAISVYTAERYREVSGRYEPTPWCGTFSDYFAVGDYLIPRRGEVAWRLPDRVHTYVRVELDSVQYE